MADNIEITKKHGNQFVKVDELGNVHEFHSDFYVNIPQNHRLKIPIDHPDNSIITSKLVDNVITTPKIVNLHVTTEKINDEAVITEKIAEQAVTTEKIADLNVVTRKIGSQAVTTPKIHDLDVTAGKLNNFLNLQGKLVQVSTPNFNDPMIPLPPGTGGTGSGTGTGTDDEIIIDLRERINQINSDLTILFGHNNTNLAEHVRIEGKVDNNYNAVNQRITEVEGKIGAGTGSEIATLLTSVTYNELTVLINQNNLISGMKYLINDFQTIYTQPVSNIEMMGEIEPIVVTAISNNRLAPIAFSTLFTQDIIFYDVMRNNRGKFTWATSNDKGQIYRRITQNDNDIPYDVRAIKFRRWAVDFGAYQNYDANRTYNKNEIVIRNDELFISLIDDNNGNTPGCTANVCRNTIWKPVVTRDNRYVGIGATFNFPNANIELNLSINASDFQDFWTFDNNGQNGIDLDTIYKNTIEFINNIRDLNNSIFVGTQIYENNIKSGIHSNTIRNNFFKNNISNDFRNNIINMNFNFNNIFQGFVENIVENNFERNIIGMGFMRNFIGNQFYNNTTEVFFQSNIIGNDFFSNLIGSSFNNNIIGNQFYRNFIGSLFIDNICSDFFTLNTTNIRFGSNIINTWCMNNTFDKHFANNNIGINFQSNLVGLSCDNNDFGNDIEFNTFGHFFVSNSLTQLNAQGNNKLRYNIFEAGLNQEKEWDYKYQDLLLSDKSVTFRKINNNTVGYSYQDENGHLVTGIV